MGPDPADRRVTATAKSTTPDIRRVFSGPLVSNTSALVGTSAVTSILGAAYWWVAAKEFTPAVVGVASAAVSAMTLLGTFATLGVGTLLIGELRRVPARAHGLLSTGLAVTAVAGAALGAGFALIAPSLSREFEGLRATVGSFAAFTVGVAVVTAGLVFDQAILGLLRGVLQFWRNVVFALAKLALLAAFAVLFSQRTPSVIFSTWTLGALISLAVLIPRGPDSRSLLLRSWRSELRAVGGLARSALAHHAFNLALVTPTLLLPIVVTVMLSAELNASFYIAWMIANFVFVIPTSLSISLYALTANDAGLLAARMRLSLGLSTTVALVANAGVFGVGHLLLRPFGEHYVHNASVPLRILALGAFPLVVKTHYIAAARISRRLGRSLPTVIGGSCLEIGAAGVGGIIWGLDGLCAGWCIGLVAEAAVMSPVVAHAIGATSRRLEEVNGHLT